MSFRDFYSVILKLIWLPVYKKVQLNYLPLSLHLLILILHTVVLSKPLNNIAYKYVLLDLHYLFINSFYPTKNCFCSIRFLCY